MSNDPLEAVFVTGDEAAELKRADTARKLATYLERMPVELRGMFDAEFQHINRAELAQLRAELQAEKTRADVLSETRTAFHMQLQAAQERIAQQAEQLEQAVKIMPYVVGILNQDLSDYGDCDHDVGLCSCGIRSVLDAIDDWLSHNAPQP